MKEIYSGEIILYMLWIRIDGERFIIINFQHGRSEVQYGM